MNDDYFNYLRKRSWLGYCYRRFWLYPILKFHMRGRALDIGCGIGDMLKARKNTVGVDVNESAVDYCRRSGLDARLMQINILPFERDSFDSVILDNVLEHISDPQPLLGEIRRVLRSGGIFIVGVPGERGYLADPDHKVFYSADDLVRVVVKSGFKRFKLLKLPLPLLSKVAKSYCVYGVFRG